MEKVIISLYDYTGEALKPWAKRGHQCYAFDIQHPIKGRIEEFKGGGTIRYEYADLHNTSTHVDLVERFRGHCQFAMGFPVCTDPAVSGAPHSKAKYHAIPLFQTIATSQAIKCDDTLSLIGAPYFVENPVSLATRWRKPDHSFHPFEYGNYIPKKEAQHPKWPEYIAPCDAYSKKTCLWTGNGFRMPVKLPVECDDFGTSPQYKKLSGKSIKTKNIRSATPRGFAEAIYVANNSVQMSFNIVQNTLQSSDKQQEARHHEE